MRRFQILGVALGVAVVVALAASPTFAVTFLLAEWLVNGAAITSELSVEISDEILLEDTKALGSKDDILCSAILDGWVGPNGLDWVSEILSLSGTAISSTPLSGTPLECEPQSGCESSSLVLVWPLGLPWEGLLELGEETLTSFFVVLLVPTKGTEIGWELTNCLVLGVSQEDQCSATELAAGLELEGTTLMDAFSTAVTELIGQKLASCSVGGAETGVVEGEGSFSLTGGGTLSASSESSEPGESADLDSELESELTKLSVPVGGTAEETFIFSESWFRSETGPLKVLTEGPFSNQTPLEKECAGKSLLLGETCLVKVKCDGKSGETGAVKVEPPRWFIPTGIRELECK